MSELSIRLLGPPRIECGGVAVEFDTRKAVALLAYLALSGDTQSRESLAGLLWPDYEPERSRASLRRTLSALRQALGGRWVVADRRAVRLERDGVSVDVDRFHALLATAAGKTETASRRALRTEAVTLYRGDFLAGFSLRGSPEFEDWVFFTAESLRREFSAALEALTEDCAATGALLEAIGHARRWLALDPLHEPAHRSLMALYAWSDQRGPALRQYRECVRTLHRELEVAPLPATQELYRAIKENRLPPPPAAPPQARLVRPESAGTGTDPSHTPRPPAAPLVGRDDDWQALLDGYAAAAEGWLAVVEGEAGVGKTRLLDELTGFVRAAGGSAIAVRCFDGEQHLPYGPIIAAVRELLADPAAAARLEGVPASWWAEAGRMLPELGARAGDPQPTPGDEVGAQARLLDAVTGILLAGLAADPPGLLVIDDAHQADGASLTLLAFAARRLARAAVGLALGWSSDAVPQGHPLRRLPGEAAGTVTHVALRRLARPDVDRLVALTRPETDAATRARVWEETEGVPLFVVEYLAVLAAGADAEDWALSGGVHELLAARVGGLDEAAGQLLTTAAVIGRSFAFSTLRDASGRGDEETVEGLEALLAHGLLREEAGERSGDPHYDFTHQQVRTHVLRVTSLARRRLLHRRVATALTQQSRGHHGTAALRARIAWHLQAAGDEDAAAEQYVHAGEQAQAVHAHAEALAHFEAALALGHPDEARLHAAIGDLDTLAGRYDEAIRRYETAAAFATGADLPAIEHRLGSVHHRLGDWGLAEDHFHAALSLLGGDGPAGRRARLLADASLTAHRRGEKQRALRVARQALPLAEEGDDPAALAQVHNLLGVLATANGNTAEAVEHLERSLAVAKAHEDPVATAGALNNLALAHRAAGSVERALRLAEEAVSVLRQIDDRHRLGAATSNLADLLRDVGRVREAEARVREAVEILARVGDDQPRPEIWKLTEW